MDRDAIAARIVDEVRPYTMVHPASLALTIHTVIDAVDRAMWGALVECGTWMGGASFAMLLAQRYAFGRIVKPVWMFDSFQGLPPAGTRDGPAAAAWQQDTASPSYFNNCTAPLDQVRAAAAHLGFSETEAIIVPGWFDATLPAQRPELEGHGVAILRIDCDWYEPVSCVLNTLGPLVEEEGRIVLDDYYAWDGCARAVHDYLSRNDLAWRLRAIGCGEDVGAWMIKHSHRMPDQVS